MRRAAGLSRRTRRPAIQDPLKTKLVETCFFAGVTLAQAVECLDISRSTADRDWRFARSWLYEAMASDGSQEIRFRLT